MHFKTDYFFLKAVGKSVYIKMLQVSFKLNFYLKKEVKVIVMYHILMSNLHMFDKTVFSISVTNKIKS